MKETFYKHFKRYIPLLNQDMFTLCFTTTELPECHLGLNDLGKQSYCDISINIEIAILYAIFIFKVPYVLEYSLNKQ